MGAPSFEEGPPENEAPSDVSRGQQRKIRLDGIFATKRHLVKNGITDVGKFFARIASEARQEPDRIVEILKREGLL